MSITKAGHKLMCAGVKFFSIKRMFLVKKSVKIDPKMASGTQKVGKALKR